MLLFSRELREGMGDVKYISVASQEAEKNWVNTDLQAGGAYDDHWRMMNCSYTVLEVQEAPQ